MSENLKSMLLGIGLGLWMYGVLVLILFAIEFI